VVGVPTNSQFPNNQWIRGAGDSYDGAGNQLSLAQYSNWGTVGSTFTYDGENRLLTANVAGTGVTSFVYDGEGRRVEKLSAAGVTTTYIHDAEGELAAEYSTAAATVLGTEYLSADHLGSTRLITSAANTLENGVSPGGAGTPMECQDYLPFGELIPAGVDGRTGCYPAMASPPNPQYPSPPDPTGDTMKFTGKERDAQTGLAIAR